MKAFVINLDRSPDRWAFMRDQAARHGIDLTRLAAEDGSAISDAEVLRLCPPDDRGRRLSRFELACYRSHMAAWVSVASCGEPYAVVFEDDIFLAEDTADFLGTPGWIPAGADVVKLSANGYRLTLSTRSFAERNGRQLHRLLSPTVDASGYILSAAHARALLAEPARFALAVDRVLLDPTPGAAIYQLLPGLCIQEKFADFAFLPGSERASQVQTPRTRKQRTLGEAVGFAKIGREARNLYAKEIRPRLLPLLQVFTPPADRVFIGRVPFRRGAGDHV